MNGYVNGGSQCDQEYTQNLLCKKTGFPQHPGKPGKMRVTFPVMEIWNFLNFEKYHGKMRGNLEK